MASTSLRTIVTSMLALVGLIHLMPIAGILGAEQLESLYGIYLTEPNILILLRHRAILFALLGLFMLLAAFREKYQPIGLVAGYISVIGFLVLSYMSGEYNSELKRVVMADLVALVALIIATVCRLKLKNLKH